MSDKPDVAPRLVLEDETFVRGCRAGDAKALDAFFRAYIGRVERVLTRLVGPTPDLDDLVQTTFIEAMRSFPRFRGEASLATWVTRIAVRVAIHQLRRGVRRAIPLGLVPTGEEACDEARGPERIASDRELATSVHAALDRLSPPKRLAFLLYTIEGQSIPEVAALMGASEAATKSRIWFARRELLALAKKDRRLRDLIERDSGGEGGGR